jgi:excisionase family DNA binding protein
MASGDRLLTIQEISDLLAVERNTLTRWVAIGRITGVKTPEGQWRFREAAVRAALSQDDSSGEV